MSVHLQKIRFFATTKDVKNAGTDSGVEMWYYVKYHPWTTYPNLGWNAKNLNHRWNDRERGRTEMYEIDFQGGNIGKNVSGTPVPKGIAFNDFSHARTATFWLKMKGRDWWKINHYYLMGYFRELRHVPGTIDMFEIKDHGWLLMARRDGDVDMSKDPSEGKTWHLIDLNGTF